MTGLSVTGSRKEVLVAGGSLTGRRRAFPRAKGPLNLKDYLQHCPISGAEKISRRIIDWYQSDVSRSEEA